MELVVRRSGQPGEGAPRPPLHDAHGADRRGSGLRPHNTSLQPRDLPGRPRPQPGSRRGQGVIRVDERGISRR